MQVLECAKDLKMKWLRALPYNLDTEINEWLAENPNAFIVAMDFKEYYSEYMSVMIAYTEGGEGR